MAVVKMQKANKILKVDELLLDKYLKLGYNQVDDQGAIIKRGTAQNRDVIKALEAEIVDLKAQIEKSSSEDIKTLKAQIKTLTDENKALKEATPK